MPTDQNAGPASGSEHSQSVPVSTKHKGVRALVWIVILLVFAVGFLLVLRKSDNTANTAGARRGFGGPVTATVATARKGNIGVYLECDRHGDAGLHRLDYQPGDWHRDRGSLQGRPDRAQGRSLIDIDPRPFQATLTASPRYFGARPDVLAQAKMDLERYRELGRGTRSPSRRSTTRKKSCCRTRAR